MKYKSPYTSDNKIHCLDTDEYCTGETYLQTKHWRQIRVNVYNQYGGICQRCGHHITLNQAQIHHVNYGNFGNEVKGDLILYCGQCHQEHHEAVRSAEYKQELQNIIADLTPGQRERVAQAIAKAIFDIPLKTMLDLHRNKPVAFKKPITATKKRKTKTPATKKKKVVKRSKPKKYNIPKTDAELRKLFVKAGIGSVFSFEYSGQEYLARVEWLSDKGVGVVFGKGQRDAFGYCELRKRMHSLPQTITDR